MTLDRGLGSSSPVHVHVEDETPIHVHVSKPKKMSATARSVQNRLKDTKTRLNSSFGNTRPRPARSRSAVGGPWVPAPGKSSKNMKVSWQGDSARLEINPGAGYGSGIRMDDLDTDDEDRVHGHMMEYEKKIDSLMTEVGTLRNEVSHMKLDNLAPTKSDSACSQSRASSVSTVSVPTSVTIPTAGTESNSGSSTVLQEGADVQRAMREIDRKDDMLNTSRQVMFEQEDDLRHTKRELTSSESENRMLRRSMVNLKDETSLTKLERDTMGHERQRLLTKLVEVEMDGQDAARQLGDLKDTIRRLKEEKRVTSADSAHLGKQKELLVQSLTHYEDANRALRRLLREQHAREAEELRMTEQRDVLMNRLAETDKENQRMRLDALDKDRRLNDMKMQAESQKEENLALSGLQTSLEQTRGHLQKQLRSKEADCNRMAVQIRSLETQLAQERIEVDHVQDLLKQMKEKTERDKEALKKATRVQKQRAARSEDTVEVMNCQLLEKETLLADCQAQVDEQRVRAEKIAKEKAQVLAENNALKIRVSEQDTEFQTCQDASRTQTESLNARLHSKTSEVSSLKLENERLRTSIQSIEDKLSQADTEVGQLKASVHQYEGLVEEYRTQNNGGQLNRSQMNQARRDAEETSFRLEESSRKTASFKRESEDEIEKVKSLLQNRLVELEPLPEMLKTAELRLHDANERLLGYERQNSENTRIITELTAKVELQNEQLNNMREKYRLAEDDVHTLQNKMDALERRLAESEAEKREHLNSVTKREETIRTNNLRLEEKTTENAALMRQLENALSESRQHADVARDAKAARERQVQSRLLELESQLSKAKAEIARFKREKDEAERKFNSRLYDIKDRLEQSHSSNRSMQNYVQFLKNSYANVFGDASLISTSSPLKPTTLT